MQGADVNIANEVGRTPLHYAAMEGHTAACIKCASTRIPNPESLHPCALRDGGRDLCRVPLLHVTCVACRYRT